MCDRIKEISTQLSQQFIGRGYTLQIKHPEWLHIVHEARTIYGLDQMWYTKKWQRTAGCGPTVGTTLLLYVNKRDDGKLTYRNEDIKIALSAMEDVWRFIKPGLMGISSTQMFTNGMNNLLKHYKTEYVCKEMTVGQNMPQSQVFAFLSEALTQDCPVAFLNLHAGDGAAFESWHWMTIMGIEEKEGVLMAEVYDAGRKMSINLTRWLKTTQKGGGFVYIHRR